MVRMEHYLVHLAQSRWACVCGGDQAGRQEMDLNDDPVGAAPLLNDLDAGAGANGIRRDRVAVDSVQPARDVDFAPADTGAAGSNQ
jgi:hypothetical protein